MTSHAPAQIVLRSYQRDVVDSLHDFLREHEGNPCAEVATGGGKSVIIAKFCEEKPDSRIIMLTHVKELVEQNYLKLRMLLPPHAVGVYCAGLKKKQPNHRVVCASIQSAYRNVETFGDRDTILIDEVHLLTASDEGMYRKFINAYPKARVIGFTATPFRTDSGAIVGKDKLLTHSVAQVTILDLLKLGYLSPLVPIDSELAYDTSSVRITAGEFNQKDLESMALDIGKTRAVIAEILAYGKSRKSWLVFANSIKHAEFVTHLLVENGISALVLHQKTPAKERARVIASYRSGKIRALVNVNILTTGFDAPETDMLVLLRPTQSLVLYVQMLGRGMRIAPGKDNCLVLDYGENIARHGPVTHIQPAARKGRVAVIRDFNEDEDEPQPKIVVCRECRAVNDVDAKACYMCGQDIVRGFVKVHHQDRASRDNIIAYTDDHKYVTMKVDSITAHRHQKEGSPDSVRIRFDCGLDSVTAWICLWHQGYAKQKARTLWSQLTMSAAVPSSVFDAVKMIKEYEGEMPVITIKRNGTRFPELLEIKYGTGIIGEDTGKAISASGATG